MFQRAAECRRGNGIVGAEHYPVASCDLRECGNIRHDQRRVGDHFEKDHLGPLVDHPLQLLGVSHIEEAGFDPETAQSVGRQSQGPAVGLFGHDDVVPSFGHIGEGIKNRRGAARCSDSCRTSLQRCKTLFKNIGRGIHQPGIDVAKLLKLEKIGGMFCALEGIGGGLVDRDRHRSLLVSFVSGMNSKCLLFHGSFLE